MVSEESHNGIAEQVGHILNRGILEVGKRFKQEGFTLGKTQEWRDRVSVSFEKEGIRITVIFDTTEDRALIIEGRKS